MLQILRAQAHHATTLREISIAAKGYWGYPAQLMAQFAQTPIITPASIASDVVYLACVQALPAGWYCLLPNSPIAILNDLWVLPAFMGKGVGRALFQHMVSQAQALGVAAIELEADPNALPFYERMGCSQIGQSLSEWGRYVPRMRYTLLPPGAGQTNSNPDTNPAITN